MKKTITLINNSHISFQYVDQTVYTDVYYAFKECSQIVYNHNGEIMNLTGDTITYKSGLIQVYHGPDIIARLQEPK